LPFLSTAFARSSHTAVWTGSEMIVFGGFVGTGVPATGTGARYDPVTDSWAAMASATSVGSPVGAVWTGTEMIVWTGFNGERYNPSTNTWTLVSQVSAPPGVSGQTAVWTGSEMIVWGGLGIGFTVNTGGRLNATTGTWSATSTAADAPSPRFRHSAVWTDKEMIVWGGGAPPAGGGNLTLLGDGARYDPVANTWTPISNIGAPTPRVDHTAVWTGKEMIVWGGSAGEDGARYDPMTNTWSPLASAGFRLGFVNHTAIWTGTEMIVWGGLVSPDDPFSKLGGRYNPATNTWRPVTRENNSLPHFEHTAVWTGAEMIIWGGLPSTGQSQPTPTPLQAGARYVP
jgi:N-acetylneuraminic acid mutarotase